MHGSFTVQAELDLNAGFTFIVNTITIHVARFISSIQEITFIHNHIGFCHLGYTKREMISLHLCEGLGCGSRLSGSSIG